jgi:poly(3-hydroxybutyrate) depolymerase
MLGRSSLFVALVCVGAVELVACGGGSGGTGTAGSTGASGSGTQGSAGATAGSTGSGTAGGGSSGAAGASAGATGNPGTAGSGGMPMLTGVGGSGGGAAGMGAAGAGMAGAGAGGAAGGGAAGSGAAGATQPKMSPGCGKIAMDGPGKWNQHNIMVTNVATAYAPKYVPRVYWTRVPTGYDNSKPINLILWGQGCGQGTTPEPIPPFENPQAAANSIIVELLAPQVSGYNCYYAGPDGDKVDSPEVPYFDQVVSEVEAQFCIDETKVFEGGYSSGGWEASLMSCVRTNVLRGTGWAAAGLQLNHPTCTGPVAALITVDKGDNGTPQAQAMAAVENIRMRNGCATTSKPWNPVWPAGAEKADISSCVLYDNCMPGYPLVWCQTTFGMHTNTEGDTHLTKDGLWGLWSTLP